MNMNTMNTKTSTRAERHEAICVALADAVARGARFIAPVTYKQVVETSKNEATHGDTYGYSMDIDEKQQSGTASVYSAKEAREMANTIVDQAWNSELPRCVRDKITELNNGVEGATASEMSRATVAAILTAPVGGKKDKLGARIGVRALKAPWAARKKARGMNLQDRNDASVGDGAFYVKGVYENDPENPPQMKNGVVVEGTGKQRLKPFADRYDAVKMALRVKFSGDDRTGGWWEQPEVIEHVGDKKKSARKDALYELVADLITTRISRRKMRADEAKPAPAPASSGPSPIDMTVKQLRETLQQKGIPVGFLNSMKKAELVKLLESYLKQKA